MIIFKVHGRPQPAGSKRAFTHPTTGRALITDQNARAKPWMQQVAGVARDVCASHEMPVFRGAVGLSMTFVLGRPRGHYGSGKNAETVKASAPDYPAVMPDLTKLVRGTEDALKGILWRDDAQVVTQSVQKVYGEPEGVEVVVWGW